MKVVAVETAATVRAGRAVHAPGTLSTTTTTAILNQDQSVLIRSDNSVDRS
jgi:hypothetical protein